MIYEVRYKGQIIDQRDIEVTWSDRFGEKLTGSIEDFGIDNYQEGYAEMIEGLCYQIFNHGYSYCFEKYLKRD